MPSLREQGFVKLMMGAMVTVALAWGGWITTTVIEHARQIAVQETILLNIDQRTTRIETKLDKLVEDTNARAHPNSTP